MNPSTIVYGMKWNWTVSFAMWSTTRSALVWQRIHAPGLGRAHGWGWQAKAPAPRYLPHNSCRLPKTHSCRLAKRHTASELLPRRRSEEHTSELQSLRHLVCRLLLEKKKKK